MVIDKLSEERYNPVYFYFRETDFVSLNPVEMLKTFIAQLFQPHSSSSPLIERLYDYSKVGHFDPPISMLLNFLLQLIKESTFEVVIIMDAFDEYAIHEDKPSLINIIQFLYKSDIKILLTTRLHEVEVLKDALPSVYFSTIEVRATEQDLKTFVTAQLRNKRHLHHVMDAQGIDTVINKANGMYVYRLFGPQLIQVRFYYDSNEIYSGWTQCKSS